MGGSRIGQFYFLCFVLFSQITNSQTSIKNLHQQSAQQFKIGNYAEALNYKLKALQLAELENNTSLISYCNIEVGRMNYFLKDKKAALSYFFRAHQLIKNNKIDSLKFRVAYNIGVVYAEQELADSALHFYKEANLALANDSNYKDFAKLNGVIADLYLNQKSDLPLAKHHIELAENFAEKSKDLGWKAFVCIKYSIYYKFTKDYVLCVKYAKKACELFEKQGELDGRMYGLKVLADAYILNGNPEAKIVYERLLMLRDSVFGIETSSKIANYKTLYETEKKEAQNKLLQQENKLSQSQIDEKNKTIIGLLIGVLLIIILVFWRVSVINLKKKNRELEAAQEIQKEKERISRDLHDNVGGQLSYVLYSLDGLNDENKNKRLELTSSINVAIRNVISNLRETIWAISDESITINDFSDKLKVYARTMFRNTETNIVFSEHINQNIQLNSLVGLNLYRICQEIINNAFKHAKASELKIDISVNEKTRIVIADNGIGFNMQEDSEEGFGLTNIKSRAKEIGIVLEVKSEPNKGVTYTLLV